MGIFLAFDFSRVAAPALIVPASLATPAPRQTQTLSPSRPSRLSGIRCKVLRVALCPHQVILEPLEHGEDRGPQEKSEEATNLRDEALDAVEVDVFPNLELAVEHSKADPDIAGLAENKRMT